MTFYDFALRFADGHCFLAFLVIWFCCQLVLYPFKLCNRLVRHANIRKAGWPPVYLDADGDKVTRSDK